MNRIVLAALVAVLVAGPAYADASRYHRYWQEAKDYATRGFAEADKALAVMKTDHAAYCYQLAMTRTELERSTKLSMYAFEQIDADATLTDEKKSKLEPMIDDYKGIQQITNRYVALQETRCLAGPSYSESIPSIDDSSRDDDASDWDDESRDNLNDEEEWDDYDASEDDNF
jgi:hypothetical protein